LWQNVSRKQWRWQNLFFDEPLKLITSLYSDGCQAGGSSSFWHSLFKNVVWKTRGSKLIFHYCFQLHYNFKNLKLELWNDLFKNNLLKNNFKRKQNKFCCKFFQGCLIYGLVWHSKSVVPNLCAAKKNVNPQKMIFEKFIHTCKNSIFFLILKRNPKQF